MDDARDPFDEPDEIGERRFFDFTSPAGLPLNGSLAAASGTPSAPGPYATPIVERCETAWRTPFGELTCNQVHALLAQDMGTAWLAKPALDFTRRYPDAYVAAYSGDMLLLCLRKAEVMHAHAPLEFRALLAAAPDHMEPLFGWSREQLREAQTLLAAATAVACGA